MMGSDAIYTATLDQTAIMSPKLNNRGVQSTVQWEFDLQWRGLHCSATSRSHYVEMNEGKGKIVGSNSHID